MQPPIKALVFDVLGTVVDWRSGIMAEVEAAGRRHGIMPDTTDWAKFTEIWHDGHMRGARRVASGADGPGKADDMHCQALDALLISPEFAHVGAAWDESTRADVNLVWHRLKGWPDTVEGLTELRKKLILAPLSNGNMRLLVDMARHANLPWDVVFSTELFGTYKPNPLTYQSAIHHLDLLPEECAMVAAHIYDLRAAAQQGMRTIYVHRPHEDCDLNGVDQGASVKSKTEGGDVDLVVDSLVELAAIMDSMSCSL
ncbi:hypothetical protein D9619_012321 [Psilocybe cf. subviscida]|uniref:Haloacid dehalogenase n=1 Tax=Psilocybe cf. subviscida TaxID=2480587 RepID=A0A8H5ERB3_9AGAR|nr:hypothetical protein D9619_012321 [Psilocybe cf. subviscida]